MKKFLFLCGFLAMFMCVSATESKCGLDNDVGCSISEYNIVTNFSAENVVDFQVSAQAAYGYVLQNVQYVKADFTPASPPLKIPIERWNIYENNYAIYNISAFSGLKYIMNPPFDAMKSSNLNKYKSQRNF